MAVGTVEYDTSSLGVTEGGVVEGTTEDVQRERHRRTLLARLWMEIFRSEEWVVDSRETEPHGRVAPG
jgi:hypothetical protein